MSGGKKKHEKQRMYSAAEVNRIRKETADDATARIILLAVTAAQDEFGATDDQLVSFMNRIQRYTDFLEKRLVDAAAMSESIRKHTGIQLKLTRW